MSVHAVTLNRRVTDKGEPTNLDLLIKLEQFMGEHRRDHATLEARLAIRDTADALLAARVSGLQKLADEVMNLHDFQVQVETIGASVRWIMGGSLVAAIAATISLFIGLSHIMGGF